MRIVALLFLVCWGHADATPVGLTARARGYCEGSEHQITVTGTTSIDVFPDLVGVYVVRQSVGICESDDIVPDNPVPLEVVDEGPYLVEFSASFVVDPPQDGVNYRYIPRFVHAEGLDVSVSSGCAGNGFVSALIGCQEVPLHRGELEMVDIIDGEWVYGVAACDDDCWTEHVFAHMDAAVLEELLGPDWMIYVGQIVDVFGDRVDCAMIGGDTHVITHIAVAPNGSCGPVPVRQVDWGSIKGFFR